jgi:hypothetical protein
LAVDFLRVFEAKALAAALTDAGHSVSERTVQRWKAGETHPKPQDVAAIRRLIGASLPDTQKNAPAEAGALLDEWFARWQKSESPDWAKDLTQDILNAIEGGRQAAVDAAIAAAVDVAERRLFGDTDPEDDSPPPDRPLGPGGSPSGRGTSGARPRS